MKCMYAFYIADSIIFLLVNYLYSLHKHAHICNNTYVVQAYSQSTLLAYTLLSYIGMICLLMCAPKWLTTTLLLIKVYPRVLTADFIRLCITSFNCLMNYLWYNDMLYVHNVILLFHWQEFWCSIWQKITLT